MCRLFVLIFAASFFVPAHAATIEELQAFCAQKTLVMGRDGAGGIIQTGERLGGYCVGFLEGAFNVMRLAKTICPDKNASRAGFDPSFLLSVVETYVRDKTIRSIDAASVVSDAYRRAFPCK